MEQGERDKLTLQSIKYGLDTIKESLQYMLDFGENFSNLSKITLEIVGHSGGDSSWEAVIRVRPGVETKPGITMVKLSKITEETENG